MAKEKDKKIYIIDYDLTFINIFSIVILGITILITFGLYTLKGLNMEDVFLTISPLEITICIILMFGWLVLHEIIHGLFYLINGAHKEYITYGAALEKGIFYCKCGEFVDKKNIMMSVIAPFTIIGVITYIIGFIINSPLLLILSIINICGASGDLTVFAFFVKRNKDIRFKELEDSTKFCLETTEDLTNQKFIGLKVTKVVEDPKEIEEAKRPLITVTKPSKVILIIFLIIVILNIILDLVSKS